MKYKNTATILLALILFSISIQAQQQTEKKPIENFEITVHYLVPATAEIEKSSLPSNLSSLAKSIKNEYKIEGLRNLLTQFGRTGSNGRMESRELLSGSDKTKAVLSSLFDGIRTIDNGIFVEKFVTSIYVETSPSTASVIRQYDSTHPSLIVDNFVPLFVSKQSVRIEDGNEEIKTVFVVVTIKKVK